MYLLALNIILNMILSLRLRTILIFPFLRNLILTCISLSFSMFSLQSSQFLSLSFTESFPVRKLLLLFHLLDRFFQSWNLGAQFSRYHVAQFFVVGKNSIQD